MSCRSLDNRYLEGFSIGDYDIHTNPFAKEIDAPFKDLMDILRESNSQSHPQVGDLIRGFIEKVETIFRGESKEKRGILPVELFDEKAPPVVKLLVSKMQDPQSPFYSEGFAKDANVILEIKKSPKPEASLALLEQLRQLEILNKRQKEVTIEGMDRLNRLKGRLEQNETALKNRVQALGQKNIETAQKLKAEIKEKEESEEDLRNLIKKDLITLFQETDELKKGINAIQQKRVISANQLQEAGKANSQLKNEINKLQSEAKSRKSGWMTKVVCICVSVAASWVLKQPIIITPNGITIGF